MNSINSALRKLHARKLHLYINTKCTEASPRLEIIAALPTPTNKMKLEDLLVRNVTEITILRVPKPKHSLEPQDSFTLICSNSQIGYLNVSALNR
jgi:hypothetical protein